MANKDGTQPPSEEEARKQTQDALNQPDKVESKIKVVQEDAAGPSQTPNLPGSVLFKSSLSKQGLSRSEHNIRQIHTKDLALNLTSMSLGPQVHELNRNSVDTNIPVEANNDDSMFMDLKKFMASYFRISRENEVAMNEFQNTALNAVPSERIQPPELAAHTENKAPVPSEVIVPNPAIEPILSRDESEIKKKNGSLSERSGFGVAQRDSLSSIGSNVCRICMTRGRERLISPCNCKGSLANVHLTCLERWLNQVGRNHCELCGFSYPAIRTPRYTVLQALRLWFGNPRNRSHLQSDCLIFWLLSTVTAGLLAVCIVGTQYFVIEGSKFGKHNGIGGKEEGISHRITETAMDFFMAIVLCGYCVTVYLLCKDHYVMWNRWRRANVHVRLLLSADANPVPFVPRTYNNIV